MEEILFGLAGIAEWLAEGAAVIVVAYGTIEAFVKLLRIGVRPAATHGERKVVWRRFGTWLLLGLEFQLAADIVASVVSPTWQDIGQLGAIAVIRTFLNHFLERDIEHAEKASDRTAVPAAADARGRPGAGAPAA